MNALKRSETLAWASLGALIVIAAILLAGGIAYQVTAFWAGMMLALAQALAVGLAAWGLMLARQSAELGGEPIHRIQRDQPASGAGGGGGFRMSMGGDETIQTATPSDVRTLDTLFQRLLVGLSGGILIALGLLTALLVYWVYKWSQAHPDLPVPVFGPYGKTTVEGLNELALVTGLGAAAIYGVFWWLTRPRRDAEGFGDAVAGTFTLGIVGMAALAVATLLAYFKVSFASEIAAGIISALMLLQGLELLVNCTRSYSNVEEYDQEAVDLQALPLVPMLGSSWLGGLKMLFAQSVGLSNKEKGEPGVFARMMPRAILAMILIAIAVSCIRVVKPGEVAILERLGSVPMDGQGAQVRVRDDAVLKPGLHITFPWPIDELVTVPTDDLQLTDVGAELHAPPEWKTLDIQFWKFRAPKATEDEAAEDEFLTGDPGRAMLETYVQVRWRVKDPALFYTALSHSEFYEKSGTETKTLPIYSAIIQQCTTWAVTHAFAIHGWEDILIKSRTEVENHTKRMLQEKLDDMHSGIDVVNLTIKDLHPPYWREDREGDPTAPLIAGKRVSRGPASAFENVVSTAQFWEMQKSLAQTQKEAAISLATGQADAAKSSAQADKENRIAKALGEAGRLGTMFEKIPPKERDLQLSLLMQQMRFRAVQEQLNPSTGIAPTKIIVDPKAQFNIWQIPQNNGLPVPSGGPPGG